MLEHAAAKGTHGFGERQTGKIGGEFLQRRWFERRGDTVLAVEVGQRLLDAGEKLVGAGESELERSGFAVEFRRKLDGACGDNDGTASLAELFGEFAEASADLVVLAVAGEILEEEDAIALNRGDIGECGFGRLRVVDGSAAETREPEGHAPGEERDAEVGGNFEQKLFDAVFFAGFDGEDGVAGIDEEP